MRTAIFASGAIGMIIFLAYPVAPPRLTGLGLTDTVTSYSHAYRALQPPSLMDRYAALPSLHFGWDLLVGLTLARFHPRTAVRVLGALMPVAMALAVVMTANHYVLDVVVGGIVAMAGLAIAIAAHPRARAACRARSADAFGRRGDVVDAPLLIAHRAGNDPARLRAAEATGADVIEADLHLRRGQARAPPPEDRRPAAALLGSLGARAALAAFRRPRRPARRRRGPRRCSCSTSRAAIRAAARMLSATLDARRAPRARVSCPPARGRCSTRSTLRSAQRIGSAARPRQLERLIAHAATHSLDGASLHLRLLEAGACGPCAARAAADDVARQPPATRPIAPRRSASPD